MAEQTTCACGHDAAHHSKRDSVYAGLMADYRVVWRCAWRGCGCPEFVRAARSASSSDGTSEAGTRCGQTVRRV